MCRSLDDCDDFVRYRESLCDIAVSLGAGFRCGCALFGVCCGCGSAGLPAADEARGVPAAPHLSPLLAPLWLTAASMASESIWETVRNNILSI